MARNTLGSLTIKHPQIKHVYRGKVRDVYQLENGKLAMIVSDRISAFDHILPRLIPKKGAVLNQIAEYFLEATKDVVPNWLENVIDPNISVGKMCKPIKLEMVVRGYLVGHAWRTYSSGERMLCGVEMPDGMIKNQAFKTPIITPSTKADEGHDEDISQEDILRKGIVSEEIWNQLKHYSLALFQRGSEMADQRGLILADSKYEFGIDKSGTLILIDEVHTPDSSRYFYKNEFDTKIANGEEPEQLSKEFVREWLISQDFMGKEGQIMPSMSDELVASISNRYVKLYEEITGNTFRYDDRDVENRVEKKFVEYLDNQ
ncbi:MAG TPA: phosphoribosylaminoimidazolesuccinocarboxamide synthase [Saprospiraceae bacterium]|nr:phosphoribosylaminoimidazolesuccinocarboxamide synthase [Saprospiraceae bacterium]